MSNYVKGDKELIKALQKLEKKIANKIVVNELKSGAKEMAAAMKDLAPEDTGVLKRRIKVKRKKTKKGKISFTAQVAASSFPEDHWYATFPDLGSVKQEAQDFTAKAAGKTFPNLGESVPQRIGDAIEREAGK